MQKKSVKVFFRLELMDALVRSYFFLEFEMRENQTWIRICFSICSLILKKKTSSCVSMEVFIFCYSLCVSTVIFGRASTVYNGVRSSSLFFFRSFVSMFTEWKSYLNFACGIAFYVLCALVLS